MNKAEFIAAIAEKAGKLKADVEVICSATFEIITETLSEQGKVIIPGFGSFATKIRDERKGRHPSTRQEMIIPKTIAARFRPATQLKKTINKNHQK
jgi:nucleoid DNA-binding protein